MIFFARLAELWFQLQNLISWAVRECFRQWFSGGPVKTQITGLYLPDFLTYLVDPESGPRMCISTKFPGSSGNHTLRTTVLEAISSSPGFQVLWQSTHQLKFLFSLQEIRILWKLWTIFPKLRLLKMTLLGYHHIPDSVLPFIVPFLPISLLNVFLCWVGMC